MSVTRAIIERHLLKLAPDCAKVSSNDTTYGYSFANVPLESNDADTEYLQDCAYSAFESFPFKIGDTVIVKGVQGTSFKEYKGYLGIVTTWVSSDVVMVLLEANGKHLSLNKIQVELI